jgi:CelD/BcsL family acetyltransferase involved in cellulose biosynthesis
LLHIEKITDLVRLGELRTEWTALDAAQELRLPFTSPHWVLNWWRFFARAQLAARDELHCYAIRDADGLLVGFAPMFVTHRPGFGPLRLRELQFFGADPYVTEWRGVLCHPVRRQEIIAALAARIDREQPADFVQWRGLPDGIERSTLPGLGVSEAMTTKVFYLRLPETWEAFRQGLPRNIKESLRKCYNSLARDNHEVRLEVKSSPHETDAALDQFFRLHSGRADATGTIDHPNVFETPHAEAFLRAACQDFARDDQLRIFQLVIADRVVATRIGLQMGDQIFMYFSGYDLEWARYSVMTTTVAEAIKWSIANGLRIFNLSTGEDVSKTRWRPECAQFFGGYGLYGQGVGRLAISAIHNVRSRRTAGSARAGVATA